MLNKLTNVIKNKMQSNIQIDKDTKIHLDYTHRLRVDIENKIRPIEREYNILIHTFWQQGCFEISYENYNVSFLYIEDEDVTDIYECPLHILVKFCDVVQNAIQNNDFDNQMYQNIFIKYLG